MSNENNERNENDVEEADATPEVVESTTEATTDEKTETASEEPKTEVEKAPKVASKSDELGDATNSSTDGSRKWYVIHTQTGSEEKAKAGLLSNMASTDLKKYVEEVVVPTEQVSEIRSGKKRITERKFFPGYILIKMEMCKESWYLVKTTPGITGFIGPGRKPAAITEDEVDFILRRKEDTETKPMPKITFDIGESIRIAQGSFANFNGQVTEVFPERGKLKVSVSIFGRSTPVELEYWQVEKI